MGEKDREKQLRLFTCPSDIAPSKLASMTNLGFLLRLPSEGGLEPWNAQWVSGKPFFRYNPLEIYVGFHPLG